MLVSLLTPTHDRPLAFSRCQEYVARQDYEGEVEWIVVDDGRRPIETTVAQRHVRRRTHGNRLDSFRGNLLRGLHVAQGDVIVFMEDDDWYHPSHLRTIVSMLGDADLAGFSHARYYNIRHRRFRQLHNRRHASLCQTAMTREAVAHFTKIVEQAKRFFVDIAMWRRFPGRKQLSRQFTCLGMKGMPGTAGLGMGHRPRGSAWKADDDLTTLTKLIGAEDAAWYAQHAVSDCRSAG